MGGRNHGDGHRVRSRPRAQLKRRLAAAVLGLAGAVACSATSTPALPAGPVTTPPPQTQTFADLAIRLATSDHRPASRSTYLKPLLRLHRVCGAGSVDALDATIFSFGVDLKALDVIAAPFATAEAALVAGARSGEDCNALFDAYVKEINGRLHGSASLYSGAVRFVPPLPAELALAAIRHSLLPGRVQVVYALKAYSCQQAIFMGPKLGRRYGNASLGAFVELTSGRGVGHGKYDANQVNLARITPLGRIGGQPCR